MPRDVELPSLGESVESGRVLDVLVAEGDQVEEGDEILAVETDKASVEVPSPVSGTVAKILVSEGDEVSPGDPVFRLEEGDDSHDGGSGDEGSGEGASSEDEACKSDKSRRSGTSGSSAKKKKKGKRKGKARRSRAGAADGDEDDERTASPEYDAGAAEGEAEDRETAADGGGDDERSEHEDAGEEKDAGEVEDEDAKAEAEDAEDEKDAGEAEDEDAKAEAHQDAEDEKDTEDEKDADEGEDEDRDRAPELPDFSRFGSVRREPMGEVRARTAATIAEAWRYVPQAAYFDEVDVARVEAFRASVERRFESGVSWTAILVKTFAAALERTPQLNASVDVERGERVLKDYVHVGVSMQQARGRIAPVLRDVPDRNLIDIEEALQELQDRARRGQLPPEDLEGANATLHDHTHLGTGAFTPTVVWPEVAALGCGAPRDDVVVHEGRPQTVRRLPLCLAVDSRVVTPVEAARFLRWIRDSLEHPMSVWLPG